MRKISSFVLICVLLLIAICSNGAINWLYLPVSAKSAAMSSAVSSLPGDESAMQFNPATLGFSEVPSIYGTSSSCSTGLYLSSYVEKLLNVRSSLPGYTGLYPNLYYLSGGAVLPTKVGTFGGNITYLTTEETEAIDPYGREIAKFRSSGFVAQLSYGRKLRKNLAVGVSAKFIYDSSCPSWIIWEVL